MENNNANNQPNQMNNGMPMDGYPQQPQQPQQFQQFQPQQYPYTNQPMAQQPQKKMDPEKKKRIIMWTSISCAIAVLGIAALIIIPIIIRVDYGTAYNTAKELKPKISAIYQNNDCGYVENYAASAYIEPKTYNEYIESCKKSYDPTVNELIAQLESTDGVKRNKDINAQFVKFKAEFDSLENGNPDILKEKLSLWKAIHNYSYLANGLHSASTDAEITKAATYLINTENEALKTFGEGWQERALDLTKTYRAYQAATSEKSTELYEEYNNKRKELEDWIATNSPDFGTLAPLHVDDTAKVNSDFNELYEMIRSTYQANYNSGSDDCLEFLGEVFCD